jgi:uncharacterized membrane protein
MPALIARIVLIGVIIPLNIPIYRWAWRLCFGTMEEFEICIGYVMEFQLVSLFKFEYHRSAYATFKVALFVLICGGVIALEFTGLILVFQAARALWGAWVS